MCLRLFESVTQRDLESPICTLYDFNHHVDRFICYLYVTNYSLDTPCRGFENKQKLTAENNMNEMCILLFSRWNSIASHVRCVVENSLLHSHRLNARYVFDWHYHLLFVAHKFIFDLQPHFQFTFIYRHNFRWNC